MSSQGKTSDFLPTGLLLGGLVSIFAGQRVLTDGTGHQISTYGGLALVVSALAMRARAFAGTSGDVRAVEGRLLATYGGVVASLGLYALSTDAGIKALSLTGDTATHVGGALHGLWMAVMLVSVVAALFAELAYARMPIPASVELRRVSTALQAGVSLALSVVFLLSINYVATARDVRKDVSYFRTTEPSEGTRKMIGKLDQKLKAVLFYESASDVLQQLRPYFESIKGINKKFSYEVIDVALVPELATKFKVRDNGNVLLVRGEGDERKGEFFRVGTELTEARATLRKLDGTFQQVFSKLVRPERTLYLTVGHGERNAKSSDLPQAERTAVMSDVLRRLNLKTNDLGVAQGLAREIPGTASAVVVIGPSGEFMAEEAEALLKYVRSGGKLMLMLDPGQKNGLEPLLEGLGIELLPGTVTSDSNFMVHQHNDSDKSIVFTNSYTAHPSVTTVQRHQRELASVFVRAVGLKQSAAKAEPKPRVTFPVRTARDAYRDLDGDFKRGGSEVAEQINLVAASTITVEGGKEGRAIVIGDGDFMTDKVAPNNGNFLLFVDALGWLVGNEDLSGEVSSEEDIAIEHSREQDKVWFYATTFLVPAPIVGLGLWVSRRRRNRAEVKS